MKLCCSVLFFFKKKQEQQIKLKFSFIKREAKEKGFGKESERMFILDLRNRKL